MHFAASHAKCLWKPSQTCALQQAHIYPDAAHQGPDIQHPDTQASRLVKVTLCHSLVMRPFTKGSGRMGSRGMKGIFFSLLNIVHLTTSQHDSVVGSIACLGRNDDYFVRAIYTGMTCISRKTHVMHILTCKRQRRTFLHQHILGWIIYSICQSVDGCSSLAVLGRCLYTCPVL